MKNLKVKMLHKYKNICVTFFVQKMNNFFLFCNNKSIN